VGIFTLISALRNQADMDFLDEACRRTVRRIKAGL
jgi:hypothetical protein